MAIFINHHHNNHRDYIRYDWWRPGSADNWPWQRLRSEREHPPGFNVVKLITFQNFQHNVSKCASNCLKKPKRSSNDICKKLNTLCLQSGRVSAPISVPIRQPGKFQVGHRLNTQTTDYLSLVIRFDNWWSDYWQTSQFTDLCMYFKARSKFRDVGKRLVDKTFLNLKLRNWRKVCSLIQNTNNFIRVRELPEKKSIGFTYCGAKIFNSLPNEIRETQDINTFKSLVKDWMWREIPSYQTNF